MREMTEKNANSHSTNSQAITPQAPGRRAGSPHPALLTRPNRQMLMKVNQKIDRKRDWNSQNLRAAPAPERPPEGSPDSPKLKQRNKLIREGLVRGLSCIACLPPRLSHSWYLNSPPLCLLLSLLNLFVRRDVGTCGLQNYDTTYK